MPLSEVVKSEWWTGECDYNLGVYLRDAEPLLMRVHGAARWKFAIDDCLVAMGREHRGLPRVKKTKVRAASQRPALAERPETHLTEGASGDHLPQEVELTLGDGSKRPLSQRAEVVVRPGERDADDAARAEETYLRVPLAKVRAVQLENSEQTIRLRLHHVDGRATTLVEVDEDARIELER